MKIGEVVKLLNEDYPSISISRIRFLEKEGLIKIRRTKGGTREISESNILTLKQILNLQENHYVSLKAIKNNPTILTKGVNVSSKKEYTISDALKSSGLSKKIFNDLIDNNYETLKDEYSIDDINRFKSWNYLFSKGIKINNLAVIEGLSNRGAPYLEQIVKSNSIPKDQVSDLSKHFGNVIGGTIFLHMDL